MFFMRRSYLKKRFLALMIDYVSSGFISFYYFFSLR